MVKHLSLSKIPPSGFRFLYQISGLYINTPKLKIPGFILMGCPGTDKEHDFTDERLVEEK